MINEHLLLSFYPDFVFILIGLCYTVKGINVRSKLTPRLSSFHGQALPAIVTAPALVVTWSVYIFRMYTYVIYLYVYASSCFACCPRRYTYIDTVKILNHTSPPWSSPPNTDW